MGAFFILSEKTIRGTIIKIISKDYYVRSEDKQIVRCSLRGKFKLEIKHKKDKLVTFDYAAIGDLTEFTLLTDNMGVIEKIYERKNYLSRKAGKARGSLKRGERIEQVIASNLDNIFIVTSIKRPKFNNRFLDRVIVAAESSGINVNIIINKLDLDNKNQLTKWEQLYSSIGYKVFVTCAVSGVGVESVKRELKNRINIFWGQSGVGKSTLLNAMFSKLDFDVGEISNFSNKGMHTTVNGEMCEVDDNTFIIDTPGIREIDPYGIKKEDLSHFFKEFLPFIHGCKFNTCTHFHEPGCEILKAVDSEDISKERYQSYLNMLNTIEDDMFY